MCGTYREVLKNFALKGHWKERSKEKQQLTYLCEWMVEQNIDNQWSKVTYRNKRQDVMENYDHPHPKEVWHKRKRFKF